MHCTTLLPAALLATLIVACGGKSFEVDPNQGGTDAGGTNNQGGSSPKAGSAHGGDKPEGGTGQGGTARGGMGQGGSAGSTCESFDDQPGSQVAVEIYNKTSAAIHVGQDMFNCGVEPPFKVVDESGAGVGAGGDCRATCQALRTSGPVGCPAICAYPNALTLQPGEVFYTLWDARFTAEVKLPEECLPDPGYGYTCLQARAIQPGTFTFSAKAGSSLDCSSSPGCQPCTPTGNGGCTTSGALVGGERIEASARVLLDGSYGIYGSQPAPAPAPDYPGNGGADAPIAYRAVQIVFSE
jgi:hypothetical protein